MKPVFSILGDSISTYFGYNPPCNLVFYTPETAHTFGLRSVEDTWWMQVIRAFGGELCVNDSYSGSTVAGQYFPAGNHEARTANLSTPQSEPNYVLLYMGVNDFGLRVPYSGEDVNSFATAYRTAVRRIHESFPHAKIVCITPMRALPPNCAPAADAALALPETETAVSFGKKPPMTRSGYFQAIREAAEADYCILIDLAALPKAYHSLDGLHPTRIGHEQIARAVLERFLPPDAP